MRKIKEALKLKWKHGCSNKQVAKSCNISRSTIRDYVRRAEAAGLTWPLDPELDDATLEKLLFPAKPAAASSRRQMPMMAYLFGESKKKGVTLHLLWYEYKQSNPAGYQYSQLCHRYRQWVNKLHVTLRQHYRAGEKLFVDYAGQSFPIIDPSTGEIVKTYLFVATLGASSCTFAEASLTQDLSSWITAHVHAFAFFKRVTEILVPDNSKTAVTNPCTYEPDINHTY